MWHLYEAMRRYRFALLGLPLLAACPNNKPEPPGAQPPAPTVDPVAQEVLSNLDESVDPCQDFYQFACGGWLERTELPADQPRFGRFNVLRERNKLALRQILEEADGAQEPGAIKLASYYGRCMDEAAVHKRGLDPLRPALERIGEVSDRASLMRVLGGLHRHGVDGLFRFHVAPDYEQPDVYRAHLSQGGLGLPDRDYYLKKDPQGKQLVEAYRDHVARTLEMLGEKNAGKQAKAIVAFETRLAKAATPRDQLRDPVKRNNPVKLDGLTKLAPDLPWDAFFEEAGTSDTDYLNVAPPSYFIELSNIVRGTPTGTLRSYLRFHLARVHAEALPERFVQADFEFYKQRLRGQQSLAPRWKRCVESTDRALGELLGRAYVDKHFSADSREIAGDMIHRIEQAFAEGLPQLAWMDEPTRERALQKMHAIVNKVGHPLKWKDYAALQVGENHFENTWAARSFEFDRHAREVGKTVDKLEWHMTTPTVNAYYNPPNNEMVFPAGILQPPFFSPEYPMSMNFGGIGMVMGHELTHGFDDQGRKFDGDGRLREWWEAPVAKRFEERASCVEGLYDSYEVQPGLHLNGKLTLGENIADLGGIKEAYSAYSSWAKAEGVDIDGKAMGELTEAQLFFVSYGQLWCTKATSEVERVLAVTDSHSHPRYRVNGPLSQLPAFWDTFSCEEGEAMRPKNTCEVW